MAMGRPNKGVEHVENLDADRYEKDRLKTILRTIGGELSVEAACEQLGIQRARFQEIRLACLQGAVGALAPGRPGRPPLRDAEHQAEVDELQQEIADLREQLRRQQIQLDLVTEVPSLAQRGEKKGSGTKESSPKRRRKR